MAAPSVGHGRAYEGPRSGPPGHGERPRRPARSADGLGGTARKRGRQERPPHPGPSGRRHGHPHGYGYGYGYGS